MCADVLNAGELGADGIVFGVLRADGAIDAEQSGKIIELARPMSVTFHRAFDMTVDPLAALETLVDLGVDRVLTSGQRPSAMEGIGLIAELAEKAGDRIGIMPGVGIDETNIAQLIGTTRASEYHVLAQKRVQSRMAFRNDRVFMGSDDQLPEYEMLLTDRDRIRAICTAASASARRFPR